MSRLRIWWLLSGLCLVAASWRLWIPQREFPQVPLFGWACAIPTWWDWVCLVVLCGSLLGGAIAEWFQPAGQSAKFGVNRLSWLGVAVGLLGLWLVDQHRLQPWAWQMGLLALVFSLRDGEGTATEALKWIRWLTISIYFWSAASKVDPLFAATHGQTLLSALCGVLGMRTADWPASLRWWLALGLPLAELVVAIGLMCSRSRPIAMWGAIGLHLALLVTLGPWGLNHSPGVLAWNVVFMGHDFWLFRRAHTTDSLAGVDPRARSLAWNSVVRGVIGFACAWPISQPLGLCDHWLGWSVYSARTSQVRVTLSAKGIARLPTPMQRLIENGEVRFDRWSLTTLNVPNYPDLRFQLGVVAWLANEVGSDEILEVTVIAPAGTWRSDQRTECFSDVSQFSRSTDFFLNVTPR